MTAPKSASSIFAALGATISALGDVGEGRFGHQVDSKNDQLFAANLLDNKGFGHFGHLGHQKQEIPGSEAQDDAESAEREGGKRDARGESPHFQVSKLSEVSNPFPDQGFGGGHLPPADVQPVSKKAVSAGRDVNDINLEVLNALQEAGRQINIPPPTGDTPEAWQLWHQERVALWLRYGHSPVEAGNITWSEAEIIWHLWYGATPSRDRCAGCDAFMLDEPGMLLPDGAVIHVGPDYGFECQIAYDDQWRGAARAGLEALGLDPPECRE